MSVPRRHFSREFKLEAIRRVQETGRTQSEVAEELSVSANTLCRWMKQYRAEKAEPFPGKGRQKRERQAVAQYRLSRMGFMVGTANGGNPAREDCTGLLNYTIVKINDIFPVGP